MLTSTQNARKTDDAENKLTYFPDTKTIHNNQCSEHIRNCVKLTYVQTYGTDMYSVKHNANA